MPITELASLEFIPPYNLTHPPVAAIFRTLTAQQGSCSGYPLLFFTNADPSSPNEIYLLTGWQDEEAHWKWIAGKENQDLLVAIVPYLKVRDMVHLTFDFDSVPRDAEKLYCEVYEAVGESELPVREDGVGWEASGKDMKNGSDTVYYFSARPVAASDVNTRKVTLNRITVPEPSI
ncbi:hypothetical protein BV22DRAFT_1029259 [Leucogyrophana mollusca]|uniref:Uncharacterized protein n=1 Tax=Leucogyrophana mollusca TaxID=85980 RepID=A0ACB8BUK6_9AGAM|nr:hypothetical protein BV22DRAFT_1029259 [Leucogyrophana mollusca]